MKFCLSEKTPFDFEHLMMSYLRYVDENSVVLEIGASTVWKTKKMSQHCKQLIGVEYFQERLPKDFDNVRYICGDWQKITDYISKESIDVVVCSQVIEHVPNDMRALNELYHILKPGGVALITTPNIKRIVRIIVGMIAGKRKFPHGEHLREYTEDDIKSLIKKTYFGNNYQIIPIAFGMPSRPVYLYLENVPNFLRKYCHSFEIHLFKRSRQNS